MFPLSRQDIPNYNREAPGVHLDVVAPERWPSRVRGVLILSIGPFSGSTKHDNRGIMSLLNMIQTRGDLCGNLDGSLGKEAGESHPPERLVRGNPYFRVFRPRFPGVGM